MIRLFVSTLLILLLVAGCSGGDENTCASGDSPYIGCWGPQGCGATGVSINDQLLWGTIRYNFNADGNIYQDFKYYTNESCAGAVFYEDNDATDLTFTELGVETIDPELTAYRLQVIDNRFDLATPHQVLVAVVNSQLCFSGNFSINNFQGFGFTGNAIPTDIDYNNCISRTK